MARRAQAEPEVPVVADVSHAGIGRPGYCKICAWSEEPAANERIKMGWNATKLNEWASKYGFYAARHVWYRHRQHITAPQDRFVSMVERKRTEKPVIANVTTEEFLRTLTDLGMNRAIEHPEEVTIGHALKAAQILEGRREKTSDITLILAKVMTMNGSVEGRVIEMGREGNDSSAPYSAQG